MKGEKAKAVAEQGIKELALALDDGQSESLRAFLKVMGRFHRYSVGNQMLIALQRPDAERVAGYRAWQRLGRQVRKGEKGITIMAPIVARRPRWNRNDEHAKAESDIKDPNQYSVVAFRGATVFDISQTEGRPLPEFARAKGEPGACIDRLARFIQERGIELTYANTIGSARGVSRGGKIVVRSDLAAAVRFSTLVHELAHEMLHWSEGAPNSQVVQETEAEAVAFVVGQAIGLETGTASSDYIQLYRGDRKLLMASLERIRETAVEIIEGIKPEKSDSISAADRPEAVERESSPRLLAA